MIPEEGLGGKLDSCPRCGAENIPFRLYKERLVIWHACPALADKTIVMKFNSNDDTYDFHR